MTPIFSPNIKICRQLHKYRRRAAGGDTDINEGRITSSFSINSVITWVWEGGNFQIISVDQNIDVWYWRNGILEFCHSGHSFILLFFYSKINAL